MAIKFSQFNLRTDHTSGMYLVGYDGNQNIHITVDNLFDDFINGTENTIAMFGTDGTMLADSILSQDAGATTLTVAGQLNVDAAATFDTSITVTGDSTLNGNITLGDASTDLITQTGTLYLNGPVKDTTDTLGDTDKILVSDAAGELTFQKLSETHVKSSELVVQSIKANEALTKGDPVYIVGFQVGQEVNIVAKADASNPAKMPATGIIDEDYSAQAFGTMTAFGSFNTDFDASGGTENWQIGDILFVKAGGGLTNIKPTGSDLIQNVAVVSRNHQQTGELEVVALGRTNDIPNLTPGKLWVGSTGNTIESQTLFVDEANARLGINETNPGHSLDVDGTLQTSGWAYFAASGPTSLAQVGGGSTTTSQFNIMTAATGDSFIAATNTLALKANNITGIKIDNTGEVQFNQYGTGTFTGTATYNLSVDGFGNVIETAAVPANIVETITTTDGTYINLTPNSPADGAVTVTADLSATGTADATKYLRGDNTWSAISGIYDWTVAGTTGSSSVASGATITWEGGTDITTAYNANVLSIDHDDTTRADTTTSDTPGYGGTFTVVDSVTTNATGHLEAINVKTVTMPSADDTNTTYDLSGYGTTNGTAGVQLVGSDSTTDQVAVTGAGTTSVTHSGNTITVTSNDQYTGTVTGSGTASYIPKWSTSTGLTNSIIYDNGTNVGIGTTNPLHNLQIGDGTGAKSLSVSSGTESSLYLTTPNSTAQSVIGFGNNQFATINTRGRILYQSSPTSSSNYMQFNVAFNEIMRLTNSSVGIGTTSPRTKLDINGPLAVIGGTFTSGTSGADLNSSAGIVLRRGKKIFSGIPSGGNEDFYLRNLIEQDTSNNINIGQTGTGLIGDITLSTGVSGNVIFRTTGFESARIDSSGNVGIGTSSPDVKLEVVGTLRLHNGTDQGRIFFRNDRDDVYIQESNYQLVFGAPSGMVFELDTNNNDNDYFNVTHRGSSRMYINGPSGYVGIGTGANVDERLHVQGSINNDDVAIKIENSFDDNNASSAPTAALVFAAASTNGYIRVHGAPADTPAKHQIDIGSTASSSYLTFSPSTTEKMRISSAGNVGIGTTSPETKLHVEGNLLVDAYNQGEDNGIFLREGFLTIDQPSITVWDMSNSGASPDGLSINAHDGIRFRENGGEVARFKDGNFGIGTTSPNRLFHIAGASASAIMTLQRTNSNSSGSYGALQWTASDDHTVAAIDARADGNNEGAHLLFHTTSAAASNNPYGINERMRITSNGNVGIGTTNPTEELDVNGRVRIGDINYTYGGRNWHVLLAEDSNDAYISNINGNALISGGGYYFGSNLRLLNSTSTSYSGIQVRADGSIAFESATGGTAGSAIAVSEKMRVSSNGNVGIGTTSPDTFLHIDSASTNNIPLKVESGASTSFVQFMDTATTANFKVRVGSSGDNLVLFAGGSERMRINSSGNVGIGTTNPGDKFQIDAANSQLRLRDTDDGSFTQFSSSGNTLAIRQGSTSASHIWLTSAGNVGIGIQTPGQKLDVAGNIRSQFNSGDYSQLESNGSGGVIKALSSGSTNILFRSYGDSYILNDLGIGVSSPGARLHAYSGGKAAIIRSLQSVGLEVQGGGNGQDIAIFKNISGTEIFSLSSGGSMSNLGMASSSSANASLMHNSSTGLIYRYTSSIRYKEDVKDLTNAVDKIMKLRPVEFKPKDSLKYTTGMIAEEVFEVMPEITFEAEIEGFDEPQVDGISYEPLHAYYIKAIQELSSKIESLETRIQTLENN